MQTIQFATLSEVRMLPAEGPRRDRQLNRLVDLYASIEAAVALQAAASRAREEASDFADVLTAADAVFSGILVDPSLVMDDSRNRLRDAVTAPEFLARLPEWIRELRKGASLEPESGACTVATALELWSWTMNHRSESATDELTDAVCPLLAARCLALDVTGGDELPRDLCHAFAARVAAVAGATCADIIYGYRRHPTWDAEGCAACYASDDLDALEAIMPGIGSCAGIDVVGPDGSHPAKAGPCAGFEGLDAFVRLRKRLDGCLSGSRIAKDRAAAALVKLAVVSEVRS